MTKLTNAKPHLGMARPRGGPEPPVSLWKQNKKFEFYKTLNCLF